MARIRSIKPAFFRNFKLYQLEKIENIPVRVAFAGLWTAADKSGRFRWRPEELKLDCLPFDHVDFDVVLAVLERGGFIRRYETDGVVYGSIPGWERHQRPRNDEEDSTLPAPPNPTVETVTDSSLFSDEAVTAQSLGKEGKGREEEREESTPSASAARNDIVLVFPTDGKPRQWHLRAAQVAEWQKTYPKLDVRDECQRALTWVQASPQHHKTAGGMPKFLVNWLNRSTNGTRGANGNGRAPSDYPITGAERQKAEQVRRAMGFCGHNPKCRTLPECVGRIVRQWREEEQAAMRGDE